MKNKMHLNASSEIFIRAKMLRLKMTKAEKILWQELRNKKLNGYKFRNQHPILKFILDFYCHSENIGIEVDGGVHSNAAQKFYDEDRTEIMKEFGIRIIRFNNEEIFQNLDDVKQRIIDFIDNR